MASDLLVVCRIHRKMNNIQFSPCMHLVLESNICSFKTSRGSLLSTMPIVNGVWLIVIASKSPQEKLSLQHSWY
jgi:hypothetical protein